MYMDPAPSSCAPGAALPDDETAGQLHAHGVLMSAADMVEEETDRMVRHLLLRDIDGGEHGTCLLRFLNVVNGDDRGDVALPAVLFQTVKDTEGSAVVGTENGGRQLIFL